MSSCAAISLFARSVTTIWQESRAQLISGDPHNLWINTHIPLSPAPPLPLAKLLQEVLAQLKVRLVHLRVQTPPLAGAFWIGS